VWDERESMVWLWTGLSAKISNCEDSWAASRIVFCCSSVAGLAEGKYTVVAGKTTADCGKAMDGKSRERNATRERRKNRTGV
jgi:hypothetical protein